MNALERILTALQHDEPDRVPTFTQTIEPEFIARYDDEIEITGEYGIPDIGLELARELGYDSKWYHCSRWVAPKRDRPEIPGDLLKKYVKNGWEVTAGGGISARDSRGKGWYMGGILKTPELLKEWIGYTNEFQIVDDDHYKWVQQLWNESSEKIVPIPTAGGVAGSTWASIGIDRFGYMVRRHPNLVRDLVKARTKLTIEEHTVLFERGIKMVFICDDYAQKDRLIFHPKHFVEFIEPAYKLIADNAHKHDAYFLVHSDGDLTDSFPSMVRTGVDAAEPLEYEAGNNMKELKEKYGDRITLMGNVPASDALCLGTVEDTVRYTKECILDAAEGGGLILGQGANLLGNSKIENVQAMLETVQKHGTYPINKSGLVD